MQNFCNKSWAHNMNVNSHTKQRLNVDLKLRQNDDKSMMSSECVKRILSLNKEREKRKVLSYFVVISFISLKLSPFSNKTFLSAKIM